MAENKPENLEEEKTPYEQLSNTQKCAILMMLLGEDEAAEILKNLGPKEVQQLGKEMYTVQGLDQDTVNQVLDEFLAIIKTQTDLGMGSSNYIRNVMTKALGENKAQSVLGRITPTESDKPIEILDWMDARSVTELISDEHPQIMALIISYLDAGVAADVLTLMPEEIQSDLIHRVATLETVQPDALNELERVMQLKFKTNTSLRASSVGGVKAAAQIMNFTKQNMEQRIVKSLGEKDRLLAKEIQESMFTFDTLILMDDRSMQTLIRAVDQEVLIIALKGTEDELKKKIFASMSQRAAANIQDEMEVLGPLRLTEVQEAQKAIINTARTMSDEGSIVLAGRGGDDFV